MHNQKENIIEIKKGSKSLLSMVIKVTTVLKGIDLEIKRGGFMAIMGRSGASKSTLLYQISLLDHATSGEIWVDEL